MKHNFWATLLIPSFSAAATTEFNTAQSADASAIPEPWREIIVSRSLKKNQFRLKNWDGTSAIEVRSDASMSMLGRPVHVDLKSTPILCWRWRVAAPLKKANLASKSGDDFAARVYLGFRLANPERSPLENLKRKVLTGFLGEQLPDVALNYVWDNTHPIGFEADNIYTSQNKMIVIRTGGADAGHWVAERRDAYADAARMFKTESLVATHLAITSDTDNTQEKAIAGFAEIHFTTRDGSCNYNDSKDSHLKLGY